MARGGRNGFMLVVGMTVIGLGTSVLLLVTFVSHDPVTVLPAEEKTRLNTPDTDAPPVRPRRLKVAGSDGYAVIVNPDGSSYLEAPDGRQTELAGPGQAEENTAKIIERKLSEPRPKKEGLGLLIVTDTGVVDVPKDAVITFVGRDKVVTHSPDGTSKVYFVDGRVVSQARGEHNGRTP